MWKEIKRVIYLRLVGSQLFDYHGRVLKNLAEEALIVLIENETVYTQGSLHQFKFRWFKIDGLRSKLHPRF